MQHHACFGGYAACSGCNPCPNCSRVVAERVLVFAMKMAGLNGQTVADVQVMVDALRQRGVEPAQLGVRPDTLAVEPMHQVQAFWAAVDQGYSQLHQAMNDDPKLEVQLQITDVSGPVPQIVKAIGQMGLRPVDPPSPYANMPAHMQASQQAATPATPEASAPPAGTVPGFAGDPHGVLSVEQMQQLMPGYDPSVVTKAATPKVRQAPVQAEDLAAAGIPQTPAAKPSETNGVS